MIRFVALYLYYLVNSLYGPGIASGPVEVKSVRALLCAVTWFELFVLCLLSICLQA